MKKALLILAFLCFSFGFSQTDKLVNNKVVNAFKTAYNASDYESVFSLFSEDKKETFSLENTKIYFERMHKTRGDLLSLTLTRVDKDLHIYKAVFKNEVGEVVVKLNNKNKATQLDIRTTVAVKK